PRAPRASSSLWQPSRGALDRPAVWSRRPRQRGRGAQMPLRWALPGWSLALLLVACQPAVPTPPASSAAPAASVASPAPGGAAPSAAGQPAPLQKLTVAILSTNEMQTIPWVAKDSGAFARYGFDVEVVVVAGSPRVTQSLIAGDFDYAIPGA